MIGGRSIGEDLPLLDFLPDSDNWLLIEAGVFIQPGKLAKGILALVYADVLSIHKRHGARSLRANDHPTVVGYVFFKTG